jgi:hypothetical protein
MNSRMVLWFMLLGGVMPTVALAQGTTATAPCSSAEAKQFDFWVGEWDLTWPAGGGNPAGKGHNSVTKGFDGCVIQENFDGMESMPLRGMSVSMYNARMKKWQQTWVDNEGSYLDFVGAFDGKEMTLAREAVNPKGEKVWQRMVFKNITADAFDWSWESSKNGKDWQVNWPIHYVRAKK